MSRLDARNRCGRVAALAIAALALSACPEGRGGVSPPAPTPPPSAPTSAPTSPSAETAPGEPSPAQPPPGEPPPTPTEPVGAAAQRLPPEVFPDGSWSVAHLVAESPPPDETVRVTGVLASYRRCPECPANVACKPCDSFLHLTDGPLAPAGQGLYVRWTPGEPAVAVGRRYTVSGSGYSVLDGVGVSDLTRGPDPVTVSVRAEIESTSHRELPAE